MNEKRSAWHGSGVRPVSVSFANCARTQAGESLEQKGRTERLGEPVCSHYGGVRASLCTMSGPKVVWVLGSGFSRHVGGPLLNQLLTRRALEETDHVFHKPTLPGRQAVYEIFRNHSKPISNAPYWEHAEEYLDFLDTAVPEDAKRHEIVKRLAKSEIADGFNGSPKQLWERACIAIGAECSAFLSEADLDGESWEPYLRWAEDLVKPDDAIITFNYDRVLETLGDHPDRVRLIGERTVQLPHGGSVKPSMVPIYKLHGSVDWFLSEGKVIRNSGGFAAAVAAGHIPLIATPGGTKKSYCDLYLKNLWSAAKAHLRAADAVVFMGYRFPPSDSQALTELLGALKQNEQPNLRVHTSLGPITSEADTVRLGSLLRHTLRGKRTEAQSSRYQPPAGSGIKYFQVLIQPLYAQDFMSVITSEELYGEMNPIAFADAESRAS